MGKRITKINLTLDIIKKIQIQNFIDVFSFDLTNYSIWIGYPDTSGMICSYYPHSIYFSNLTDISQEYSKIIQTNLLPECNWKAFLSDYKSSIIIPIRCAKRFHCYVGLFSKTENISLEVENQFMKFYYIIEQIIKMEYQSTISNLVIFFQSNRIKRKNSRLSALDQELQREITFHNKSVKALNERELLYKTIFEKNASIKLLIDTETGDILDANYAAVDFYGYPLKKLRQMNLSHITVHSPLENQETINNIIADNKKLFHSQHKVASGEVKDVEIFSCSMEFQGVKFLYSIIHDITDRKKAEEELRKTEKRFRNMIETANEGFVMIDKESIILEINPKMTEILDRNYDQILGHSIREFLDEENNNIFSVQLKKREYGNHSRYELTFLKQNGASVICQMNASPLFNDEGSFIGSFAMVTDITLSKSYEKRLKDSERLFHNYFALSLIGMAILSPEGKWLEVNKKLCEMLGYTKSEIQNKAWKELIHPENLQETDENINSILEQYPNGYSIDKRMVCKDGNELQAIIFFRVVFESKTDLSSNYIFIQVQDITERKDLEYRFKQLIEASPDPLLLVDKKGRIQLINKQAEKQFGYTKEEVLGKNIEILIPNKYREKHKFLLESYFDNPRARTLGDSRKLTALNKQQIEFPVEISLNYLKVGGEIQAISTIRDITDRMIVEDQLRQSERNLREAQRLARLGNYHINLDKGEVILSSEVTKIFDLNSDKHFRRVEDLLNQICPEDIAMVKDKIKDISIQDSSFNFEFRVLLENGDIRYVHTIGYSTKNDESQLLVFGTIMDITERKISEQKLFYRYRIEKLITKISTKLINIPAEDLNYEIRMILKEIAGFLGNVDRGLILIFNDDFSNFQTRIEWNLTNTESSLEDFIDGFFGDFKWLREKVKNNEIIHIESIRSLSEEAIYEKKYIIESNIKSTIIVPMYEKNFSKGILRFDSLSKEKSWEKEDVELLKIVSTVFLNTLTRRNIENKLRESEQLFRTLVESTQDYSIIMLDKEGFISSWNTGAEKIKNYKAHEIIGKHFSIFYQDEDRRNHIPEQELEMAMYYGHFENEGWRVKKDGSRFWANVIITPLYNDRGEHTGFSEVTRDITERKKAEERLSEILIERSIILENVDVGVAFLRNKKFVWINNKMEHLFGYTIDEIKDLGSEILYPTKEDMIRAGKDPYQILLDENVYSNERIMKKKDGDMFWTHVMWKAVDPDNVRQGSILIVEDITDRKRVEDELRESELRFRNMADNAPVMLWMSGADKYSNYFNKTWLGFTGKTLSEEKGDGWSKNVHPEDYMKRQMIYNKAFEKRVPFEVEYRLLHFSGDYRWVLDKGVPRFTPNGTFIGYIGSCVDINEIKKSEQELRKAKEQAEEGNKAKSTFLSNMTHELRTPLNAILGFSQILKRDNELSLKHRNFIDMMHKSGNHLLSIVNDILDLSKIEAGHMDIIPETFSLRELFNELHNMFSFRLKEKALSLEVVVQKDIPDFLIADSKRLRQVIINLIGNSIKFTNQGGIKLEAFAEQIMEDTIESKLLLHISVKDTGRGIPEDQVEHIFKAFHQAKAQHSEGTGLGLAISSKLVKMMKGTLAVSSQPNVGSDFHFSIPVGVGDEKSIKKSEVYNHIIGYKGSKKWKVLIVDDVENNRTTLSILLKEVGFICIEADNGLTGVEKAKEENPDLIFMDIKMPIMDGLQATEQIRRTSGFEQIPIIALTASGFEGKRDSLGEYGLTDYLRKPFIESEIFNCIRKYIDIEYLEDRPEKTNTLPKTKDMNTMLNEVVNMLQSLSPQTKSNLIKAMKSQNRKEIISILDSLQVSSPETVSGREILRSKVSEFQFTFLLELTKRLSSIN